MKIHVTVFLACLLSLTWAEFRIGAFNVQSFGPTKAGKPDVMAVLAQIIQRYDILLIQEIRDNTGQAIIQLVNQANDLPGSNYMRIISERLGRNPIHQEQYAFLYKQNTGITVDGSYQYPDSDEFGRPPFSVKFTVSNTVVSTFVLAGIHTRPGRPVTIDELDALVPVHQNLTAHWSTDNIVILGDFNAGCSYVTNTELLRLRLRTDDRFRWLIGDDVNTNTGSRGCPYDRIVVSGEELVQAELEGRVFRFNESYGLNRTLTRRVSDHFPVEFSLRTGPISYSRSRTHDLGSRDHGFGRRSHDSGSRSHDLGSRKHKFGSRSYDSGSRGPAKKRAHRG